MKLVPLVSVLVLSFAPLAYAADAVTAPVKTEPAPPAATEPVKVSPALMQQNAALGVMQGHMNVLLTQKTALQAQIDALQAQIDAGKAMADKLSK